MASCRPAAAAQKFECKKRGRDTRSRAVVTFMVYALMFIGTGARRGRVHHFDDARSGSQNRRRWRRGPDERDMQEGEGDCFSLAPHAI